MIDIREMHKDEAVPVILVSAASNDKELREWADSVEYWRPTAFLNKKDPSWGVGGRGPKEFQGIVAESVKNTMAGVSRSSASHESPDAKEHLLLRNRNVSTIGLCHGELYSGIRLSRKKSVDYLLAYFVCASELQIPAIARKTWAPRIHLSSSALQTNCEARAIYSCSPLAPCWYHQLEKSSDFFIDQPHAPCRKCHE